MQRVLQYLLTLPQYVLPQHALTAVVYRLTRIETRWFRNLLINMFIMLFRVNMLEAEKSFADNYTSFNDFFTRQLKPGSRKWQLSTTQVLSPVDSSVSQLGKIDESYLFQAKGKDYSLSQLFAGNESLCQTFHQGTFVTLYLSPRDYHRIHMPVSGQLTSSTYVPGKLFAVNRSAVATIDGVFALNERYISIFDTELGKMALIMVGALFVGSMETVWAGMITPASERVLKSTQHEQDNIQLQQGEEMGRFNMGSTVILLFEQDRINWLESLGADDPIQVGQILGSTA